MKKKKINIDLEFMKSVFKKSLNNKSNLKLTSKFEEVSGWDSLGHMRVISEIEKRLKISFEIDEIVGVDTVKKLIVMTKNKNS
jgi:acyl carrier protein